VPVDEVVLLDDSRRHLHPDILEELLHVLRGADGLGAVGRGQGERDRLARLGLDLLHRDLAPETSCVGKPDEE